ncbi:MAG: signal protein [Gammaproteobacteria bacterium]|nr:MAG: signal protein [Gammaproteobacteria bacterium]RKZ94533.1 MAG: signal protein [Gammaproteobacteria bacterium]RKZ96897.1 MAG: signal protein [Gammaproteobacteria bacterium]RKZ97319.1 MAG: signal protein [Gammaproteobacteria bacterium]
MSLSKQLLILITIIFAIIFSVNFFLSIGNIKSYLEVESEIHAQDTATSLGLSLSPHMADEQDPIIRTMMNAIFDKGYYKEIRLLNVDGEALIILTNPEKIETVPQWLIELVPMKTATAVSEISSGWNISGTLYVSTNPGYAYLKLYQQAKSTFKYSLLIFLAALALLVLVLRLTLKPLKAIEKQADEISSGRFTTIDDLPWTLEVKSVAIAMNSMSRKIGGMISRLNFKVTSLSENLKQDPLTKLLNQPTFDANTKQALSSGTSGFAVFIKFDDLAQIAKDSGHKAIDQLLVDFAKILLALDQKTISAYRLYGSEFALLAPNMDHSQIKILAENIKLSITELGQQYNVEDLIHMGLVPYSRSTEFNKLSSAMLEAYEQAKNIGSNAYFIKDDIANSMSDLEWKELINTTIDDNIPEITFTAEAFNYDIETPQQVMEEAFTVVKDKNGNLVSTGTFFSMAQEFDLAEALDKYVVNHVILLMEQSEKTSPITINLAMTSIVSPRFKDWLQARLDNSLVQAGLLAFSVTAYSAAKDINAFANFSMFVKSLGATTLLKRYSSDIVAIDVLKDLHIDYLRLARDLTTDIQGNTSKPHFLELMHEVASLLDIKVIAEGVENDHDFEIVKAAGIYGISR